MLRRLDLLVLAVLATCAACAAGAGCSAVFDAGALGAGSDGGVDDGGALPDSGGEDAHAADASEGCPSGEGPRMVRIGDVCIDATEVTRAQYMRFVDAVGNDAGGPPNLPQCAANDSLEPVASVGVPAPPPETPEFPVHGIDWCDAKAYCLWAGKDLCGGVAGHALTSDDATDPKKSLWAKACSKDGTQRFGYGDKYVGGRCVDGERAVRPPDGTCEGGYPGLFDLVGNVGEWIDACRPTSVTGQFCALMGTGPKTEIASCASVDVIPAEIPWPRAGVRCCAPAK